MQINSLEPSQITQARPAAAAPVQAPPAKTPAAVKPSVKPAETVKPPVQSNGADVTAAAKSTEGTRTEITDVKPTGDTNAQGDPTFLLKVNGKEYKATQSEIIALAQKARGAEEAMRQKAEMEKLTSNLLENIDSDVYGLLVKRHGREKADQMVIAMTRKLIDEEAKDPKDREIEALRAENETHKQAEERVKKEAEDAQRKVKQAELYRTMLMDIDKELNETHLPKDKLTLTRVLNYLAAGKKSNGVAWTVKEAVQAVEVEDMSHASYYAKRYVEGKLPSEKFRQIFGDETLKKLNKEQINLLKNADKIAKTVSSNGNGEPAASGAEPAARRPRSLSRSRGSEGMSERQWRREHGSLGGI